MARILIKHCRKVVGRYYGVRRTAMLGQSHERRIVWPRQMVMALAFQATGRSLPTIGYYLGDRGPTTVAHGIREVVERLKSHEGTRIDMENFRLTLLTYKFQLEAMEVGDGVG